MDVDGDAPAQDLDALDALDRYVDEIAEIPIRSGAARPFAS